ncbi:MAG TPA: hypothetical protein RMG48_21885, partial [Myxococcales bacterium LLY-WYZ-16_1]|nr:hypothetical protein [Myxococcales bacterium LLY-WYZ-16_1]
GPRSAERSSAAARGAAYLVQRPMFWPRNPDGSLVREGAGTEAKAGASAAAPVLPPGKAAAPAAEPNEWDSGPFPARGGTAPENPAEPRPAPVEPGLLRLGGERVAPRVAAALVRGRYAVAETEGALHLVDVKEGTRALAFREMLERIRQAGAREPAALQRLLVPHVVELDPVRSARAEAARPELAALGIRVEPFGPDTWAVTAVPPGWSAEQVVEGLVHAIDAGDAAGAGLDPTTDPATARSLQRATALVRALRIDPPRNRDALQAVLDRLWTAGLHADLDGQPLVLTLDDGALGRLFGRKSK